MIFWKNKGLLIIIYCIVCVLSTLFIMQYIAESKDMRLNKDGFKLVFGIGFLLAALWTYLTRFDYYKTKAGQKLPLDIENSLFFIKMEYWHYILIGLGITFVILAFVK